MTFDLKVIELQQSGELVIENLTIEVKPGPRPTFMLRLPNGEAPAGLLQIVVFEEATGEDIWSIMYGSSSARWEPLGAQVIEGSEVDPQDPEVRQQISRFCEFLTSMVPPLGELKYGTVPPGWSQYLPTEGSEAPQLAAGKRYLVFASGAATGNAHFSVPEQ